MRFFIELQNGLKYIFFSLDDTRSQSYDYDRNVKEKHKGVQSVYIEYTWEAYKLCACHNLNFALG